MSRTRTALSLAAVLCSAHAASAQPCQPRWLPGYPYGGIPAETRVLLAREEVGGPALYAGAIGFPVQKWTRETSWTRFGNGAASVYTLAFFDDGTGEALYAGGQFASLGGGQLHNNIAKWDGTQWVALGSGVPGVNGLVRAISVYDSGGGPELWVAGLFRAAGEAPAAGLAKWNGQAWSAIGSGLTGTTSPPGNRGGYALRVIDDDGPGPLRPALYVGGSFRMVDGLPANSIARFDGTAWTALGSGLEGTGGGGPGVQSATALVIAPPDAGPSSGLLVGGAFSIAGGATAYNIAHWDGSAWSPLGTGLGAPSLDAWVNCIQFVDLPGVQGLFAGGAFRLGGGQVLNLARWDGEGWYPVVIGSSVPIVRTMTLFDDGLGTGLCMGGTSGFPGSGTTVAKWTATGLVALGGAPNGYSRAAAFDDGTGDAVFVGGDFTSIGGVVASRAARWDGSQWSALGSGLGGGQTPFIREVAVLDDGSGPALYFGGRFLEAGGAPSRGLARWRHAQWEPQEYGLGDEVEALEMVGPGRASGAYVAAHTYEVGGVSRLISGGAPVEVGRFTREGVVPAVYDLATYDEGAGPILFAAGAFDAVNGAASRAIARWDGLAWSMVGAGLESLMPGTTPTVFSLAVVDHGEGPVLYAGGWFAPAKGEPVPLLARWDGTGWSRLPLDLGTVTGPGWLEAWDDGYGQALYIGGAFTSVNGIPASYIAKWDGADWSALDAGASGPVHSMNAIDSPLGNELWVSGLFARAGGLQSSRLARYAGCRVCYADCDPSTGPGVLDIFDFLCFQNRYDAGEPYACDCDTSTGTGRCDIFDFLCFQNAFGTGCP